VGLLLLGAVTLLAVAAMVASHSVPRPESLAVNTAPFGVFYFVGAVAFSRRPGNLAARRLLAVGVIGLLAAVASPWGWMGDHIGQLLTHLTAAAWVGLFAVFPDGRYQRRYERMVVGAAFSAAIAIPLLGITIGRDLYLQPVFAAVAVGLLVLRYRRFGPEQRLQIRWPLAAAALAAVFLAIGLVLPPPPVHWVVDAAFVLLLSLLPLSLLIGMLRHRLMDVDLVIRRSLTYSTLWLGIALAYVAVAAGLGLVAGQRFPLTVAVLVTILATLIVQPARRLLERIVDRWLFGPRLDAHQFLQHLGKALERSVQVSDLGPTLAGAARSALGARWVRISLLHGEALEPIGFDGADPGVPLMAELVVPLGREDQLMGVIECGPGPDGEYSTKDEELLRTIGRQVTVAVENAAMAAELAASRARILHIEAEGRRRIERDIHDGVQQQLVALISATRLARTQAQQGSSELDRTLAEVQADVEQAVRDLRELAQGIHPSVLGTAGLVPAIESRLERVPIRVQLDASDEVCRMRFRPEVETAVYFFVLEAITNVVKHAHATTASICLSRAGKALVATVEDDGRGFDPSRARLSGLVGLRDRIEALGGQLLSRSAKAGGARIEARVPVD
jgi:signal transduction histidine kinase